MIHQLIPWYGNFKYIFLKKLVHRKSICNLVRVILFQNCDTGSWTETLNYHDLKICFNEIWKQIMTPWSHRFPKHLDVWIFWKEEWKGFKVGKFDNTQYRFWEFQNANEVDLEEPQT